MKKLIDYIYDKKTVIQCSIKEEWDFIAERYFTYLIGKFDGASCVKCFHPVSNTYYSDASTDDIKNDGKTIYPLIDFLSNDDLVTITNKRYLPGTKFTDLVNNYVFTASAKDRDWKYNHYIPVESNSLGNKTACVYRNGKWAQLEDTKGHITSIFGLSIGDELPCRVLSNWVEQGQNKWMEGRWYSSYGSFIGKSRKILDFKRHNGIFKRHNGIIGFKVAGTASEMYLKAEGFKEFMDNFDFPKKWYIRITDDNRKIVNDWKIKQEFNDCLIEYPDYEVVTENGSGGYKTTDYPTRKEINTEQFIKHVLKENPDPSPYKPELHNDVDYSIFNDFGFRGKVDNFPDLILEKPKKISNTLVLDIQPKKLELTIPKSILPTLKIEEFYLNV